MDPLDQRQRQEDRHRIVDARFDLQHAGDPLLQPHPAAVEQREDGGGVGRADDRAQQQAELPVDLQHPGGEQADQPGGQQHAHGGQRQRRPQRDAEGFVPGPQSAIEQDHGQRQIADQEAEPGIGEADSARPVHPGQHADQQEYQQERHADARREGADDDAERHHHGADQDHVFNAFQTGPCK